MAFEWKPLSPKALQSIEESTARLNIWEGAVRSSKTIASLVRWIEYVPTAPPGPLLMAAKTERTLIRNILGPLSDIVGPRRFKLNRGEGELRLAGRTIYLAGANDERAEQKIRGLTLAGAYGDELTLWPESFFKMLLSRLSVEGARLFGTTNPDSPYHPLKTDFLDRAGELDLKSWHFGMRDNLSLSEAYINALAAEYTGLWRKRYIDGLWVAAEGAIFDMFDADAHTTDEAPEAIARAWVGCDYGTTNPTVFLYVVQDANGKLWVLDEWRHDPAQAGGRQMTDVQFSEALKTFLEERTVQWVFIDPAAASFRLQAFRDGIKGVVPADNTVIDGIREVSTLLSAGRLVIHKRCEGLIREMSSYVWDAKAQKRGEDAPVKRDDHGCDALRYLIRGTRAHWGRRRDAAAN